MDGGSRHSIVTPEAVAVDLDVAGLGSRFGAAAIDLTIQTAMGVSFGIALAAPATRGLPSAAIVAIAALGFFSIGLAYFPLCEGLWSGRTPGKYVAGLRVVQSDGQPLTLGSNLVRNLIRIVDFLPAYYMIGAAVMLFSRRSQRLGDLAAGTIVVREKKLPQPGLLAPPDPTQLEYDPRLNVMRLNEQDYSLVRQYLQRRSGLDAEARIRLAAQIAGALKPKVEGALFYSGDDAFLEGVARAYRRRYSR